MEWGEFQFFKKSEFLCPCCNIEKMDSDFIRKLEDMRSRMDFAFIVTSGYRCPEYNDSISSTGRTGPHTTGHAVDLALFGKRAFSVIQQSSLGGWFTGIGLRQHGPHSKRFIHLDDLVANNGRFRPTIWTYDNV